MKEKIEGQENFILKKIRHYQGSIKDYETFWNEKIAQGESEISPETKACKDRNIELNKDFEIVPVSKDDEQPKPISPEEVKKEEEKEEKKVEKKEKEEKDDSKDDKKKSDKKKKDKE